MTPRPLRRRLACMSTRGMRHPTHCTRILNRVRTHGRLMFPHHPSRRPCLCLGGHPAQRPSWTKHPVRSDVHLFRFTPVWCGHQPHRVWMAAPVCHPPPPHTCTRCGHGCVIISVTHLASLLRRCLTQVHGVVVCRVSAPSGMDGVAWMQNTQSDRGSFTPGTSLCLVWPMMSGTRTAAFASAQRIIFPSGSSVTGSCSTHSEQIKVRLCCGSPPHVTITVSG